MTAKVTLNGRYVLDLPLVRGGMGEVWIARDSRLDRTVVVKLIHLLQDDHDVDLVRRFQREARLTSQLDHPGVPAVHDVGVHDGRPYIVMQRIRGTNVADLNAEHSPLPIGWAAFIGAQVCCVLIAAHGAGMIHRDLKPANLLLDRSGAVKVLDFGLVAAFGRQDVSPITHTGQSVGTPAYMAPEQIIGDPCTVQTDLYGLGCTLYDLLTGQPPFVGSTSFTIVNQHLHTRPACLHELRADIPKALEDIVLAMLEKKPEDRPADAVIVHDALVAFSHDLPGLPGVLDAGTDPSRAYTALSGRVPTSIGIPLPPQTMLNRTVERSDLAKADEEARALIDASRIKSAADLLGALIGPASQAFGKVDRDVVRLRISYARVLHDIGRYRAAAREQRSLAKDLADSHGRDDERVLTCRLLAARAHAMLGEHSRARHQLNELLQDLIRIHGPDDPAIRDVQDEIEHLETTPPIVAGSKPAPFSATGNRRSNIGY